MRLEIGVKDESYFHCHCSMNMLFYQWAPKRAMNSRVGGFRRQSAEFSTQQNSGISAMTHLNAFDWPLH